MFFLRNFVRSLLRFLFFVDRFSIFFNKMSAQTQPRVKKKRRNWSKGEDAVLMTKAITYYKLKEDEISKIFTKTMLVKEAAAAYGIPESVFRRRINDKLATDEGQGVGTALSKENEEKLVTWIERRKKMYLPVTYEELLLEAQKHARDPESFAGSKFKGFEKRHLLKCSGLSFVTLEFCTKKQLKLFFSI